MHEQIPYEAMILDLDGVITDTRDLHFKAWQETFNNISTFFSKEDYQRYVDGKPRIEGLRSFFIARNIPLSENKLEQLSIKKNKIFQQMIQSKGAGIFRDAIVAIKYWRKLGIPVAVISSSQNCKVILQKAGIENIFDTCVDGIEGQKLNLKGKPEPDYFIEAAIRMGRRPEDCAIVEDSISGVSAGRIGHFKAVIGVSRDGQTPAEDLFANGADVVVSSLLQIGQIKNALNAWKEILAKIGERDLAVFIDFDGTLSEIVSDPKNATISDSVKRTLATCSKALKMAVISGRDRLDVKGLVGIDSLFYAGCHGFDMSGPGCFHYQVDDAQKILPQLEEASLAVNNELAGMKGIIIERKKFMTAVHYRMAVDSAEDSIKEKVFRIIQGFSSLKAKEGKKVIELFPNLDWDKGKAIKKLCEILNINPLNALVIYIGDDLTDEDAFDRLKGTGIGIKVDESGTMPTKADYWLKDPGEVERFLNLVAFSFTGEDKRWRAGL
jgi:trehalose-phosphatase